MNLWKTIGGWARLGEPTPGSMASTVGGPPRSRMRAVAWLAAVRFDETSTNAPSRSTASHWRSHAPWRGHRPISVASPLRKSMLARRASPEGSSSSTTSASVAKVNVAASIVCGAYEVA